MKTLTPREIVRELDRYIIGQSDAKRAVAIALRNRYRRSMLPADLRDEVTPKNILMVGPTGVGKTEIARRLEAMLICANSEHMLLLSGTGEVIEPDDGVLAIGSGGNYALAAARALVENTDLPADIIAEKALRIAASICIYTNDRITLEVIRT